MGWSGTTRIPEDRKQACRDEFGPNYEILKDAMVGSTYYAAVKHLRPEREGHVFCAVTLTKIGSYEGQREFLTKGMDEGCGPCEIGCPIGILDLCSPLDDTNDPNGYARAWRQRCRDSRKKKAGVLKLVDGMMVSLPEPLDFGIHGKQQHFTVRVLPGRKRSRTVFAAAGTFFALRPHHREQLMTRADWEAKQAAAIAEAADTARVAVVTEPEGEGALTPMF